MKKLAALPAVAVSLLALGVGASSARTLVPGFAPVRDASGAGTLLAGSIPGAFAPTNPGPSFVYLPAHFSPAGRYPVVYLLHGMPGSTLSYVRGMRLAQVADRLIVTGARPFIAVVPYAGPTTHRGRAEWAGRWESYLVRNVVPWVDAHLPTIASAAGRVIAGLSAGGYGAMDIGLRHPGLFGTLESWSGYFTAPRDGPLRGASANVRETHDPTLLVQGEAPLLQRLGTRFFLSSGTTHDKVGARDAGAFSRELASLGLRHRLYLLPGGHDGRFWRAQLPAALGYALAPSSRCAVR